MKKLFIGVVAAFCCLAIAAPAIAELKLSGMLTMDAYYWARSKENAVGGLLKNATTEQDSWTTTRIVMPVAFNRFTIDWLSDDKMLRGYTQLRYGGQRGNAGISAASNVPFSDGFAVEYAWIDWHLNPNLYFRIGRQDQTFASYTPGQLMGHYDGHVVGAGFGNVHCTARDGLRAYIKFNDNVRMEVMLIDPNTEADANDELNLRRSGTLAGNALEANTIPRFDISLPIKVANFSIEPAFTYLKQEWDQVRAGDDDSYKIWGASLGAKAGFGPFTLSGEITYIENGGAGNTGGNYVGIGNGVPNLYLDTVGSQKIADGETLAWWLQAEFNFGPAAVQLIYGMDTSKNDGDPIIARDAAEYDRTQTMLGLVVPIFVAKNFTIAPQAWIYDYDSDALIGGAAGTANRTYNTDFGTQTMIGVQFMLTF